MVSFVHVKNIHFHSVVVIAPAYNLPYPKEVLGWSPRGTTSLVPPRGSLSQCINKVLLLIIINLFQGLHFLSENLNCDLRRLKQRSSVCNTADEVLFLDLDCSSQSDKAAFTRFGYVTVGE